MSSNVVVHVRCDRRHCTAAWHYTPETVDGERAHAEQSGWQRKFPNQDYCPKHADHQRAKTRKT